MAELAPIPLPGSLASRLAHPPVPGLRLFWLGQAGFVLEAAGRRLVIDPYLSDILAEKYRGAHFSHERMMPPPVTPDELGHVDLVLATHNHGDHMDPATLHPLFTLRPDARLIAPAASEVQALQRSGLPPERLVLMDAGDRIAPFEGIVVTATPAAHEARERDEAGRHRFLGYVIEADGLRIWHAGDCVPFDGLADTIARLQPDIALMPVNGRRPELRAGGVPGNFTLAEAIAISTAIGATTLIAHHYGMFAFNTVDPAAIDDAARTSPVPLLRARMGVAFEPG